MTLSPVLDAEQALLFESDVVPRYLSFFGSPAMELVLANGPARVAHIGCRTGYPDGILVDKLPGATLVGVDCSEDALRHARAKAELLGGATVTYERTEGLPTPLAAESFTHTLSIHPVGSPEERALLFAEHRRLLVPGGQAILALPLRGSFPEISDMLREYALRSDVSDLGTAVDAAAQARPTIETVAEELENAGFSDVDVDVQLIAISYATGREFIDDPATKLLVLPEVLAALRTSDAILAPSLRYLEEAITKYWSDGVFELTVNVGCIVARK